MNDYFLRLLARQRHTEMLEEARVARLSRLNRPAMSGRRERTLHMLRSFLLKFQKSAGTRVACPEERQPA